MLRWERSGVEDFHVYRNQSKKRSFAHAWNKGRLIGQKRPLQPKDVWAIRVRLQIEKRARDLAMFNLALDSKLRGCDLVNLRVDDICIAGQRERTSDDRPEENGTSRSIRDHRTHTRLASRLVGRAADGSWRLRLS